MVFSFFYIYIIVVNTHLFGHKPIFDTKNEVSETRNDTEYMFRSQKHIVVTKMCVKVDSKVSISVQR